MPRKSSSKRPANKEYKENPELEQKKPKKTCNGIDEISFGSKRKKPKQEMAGDGVSEPSAGSKKSNEIDEIFADMKKMKKKKPGHKTEKPKGDGSSKPKSMKKNQSKEANESGFIDSSRSRKKTGDGLTIYTEEELGINNANAGSTPLCPFDCECCF